MTNWECLSVEIFDNDTPDDISAIYNKPYDGLVTFELFLYEFISFNLHSEQNYILADFKIDLLKISINRHRYDLHVTNIM